MPVTTGDKLARIIGADPGSVAMHQNVSVCQSIILSCFDLTHKRNKIVYEALNFPSVMYVYAAHVKAAGAQLVEVPSEDGITIDTERLLNRESWGIVGMHERARYFGGKLKITGSLGHDTVVTLCVPMKETDD